MKTEDGYRKLCKRYNIPGDVHELTFSCQKRFPLLDNDRSRGYLRDAIYLARIKHSFALLAYVFMPTHIHLLIYPKEAQYSISRILQCIKQSVSRKEMIYLRENDPERLKMLETGQKDKPYRFWLDGGGYDRNIITEEAFQNSVAYIHNNPVRKGLVQLQGQWYWSSALDWTGTGSGPIPVDVAGFC